MDIVPNISGAGKVFEADAFDDYIYVTTGLNFTKLAYIVWYGYTWLNCWISAVDFGCCRRLSLLEQVPFWRLYLIYSPNFNDNCILWYICNWQAWMLNLNHRFQMLKKVKGLNTGLKFRSRCLLMVISKYLLSLFPLHLNGWFILWNWFTSLTGLDAES